MNGEESEAKKLISSIQEQAISADINPPSRKQSESVAREQNQNDTPAIHAAAGYESDVTQYTESSGDEGKSTEKVEATPEPVANPEPPRRRSTRSKKKVAEET